MRDFRKLIAWRKAHALAVAVHGAGRQLESSAVPGLRTQLLRAAASISANVAEGCGKRTEGEFARYVDIALGSAREVENHLELARDLGALPPDIVHDLTRDAEEVGRILYALARAVRRRMALQAEGSGSIADQR